MKYDTQYVSRDVYPCEVRIDRKIHTFAIVASCNLWQNALETEEFAPEDYAEYYKYQKDYTQLMLIGECELLLMLLPRPLDKLDCPLSVSMPLEQGERIIRGEAEFLGDKRPVELISAQFVNTCDSLKDEVENAKHKCWLERKTQSVPQCGLTTGSSLTIEALREFSHKFFAELRRECIDLPRRDLAKKCKNRSYSPGSRRILFDKWQSFKAEGGTRMASFMDENAEFCRMHGIGDLNQLELAIDSERKARGKRGRHGTAEKRRKGLSSMRS